MSIIALCCVPEEPRFKMQLPVSQKTPSNHDWNKTVHSVLFAALFRFYWRDDEIPLQEKLAESGNKSWSLEKQNKTNESTTAMLRWDTAASTDIDNNWNTSTVSANTLFPANATQGPRPLSVCGSSHHNFFFFNLPKCFSRRRNTRRWEKNDMKSLYSGEVIPFFFFLLQ